MTILHYRDNIIYRDKNMVSCYLNLSSYRFISITQPYSIVFYVSFFVYDHKHDVLLALYCSEHMLLKSFFEFTRLA